MPWQYDWNSNTGILAVNVLILQKPVSSIVLCFGGLRWCTNGWKKAVVVQRCCFLVALALLARPVLALPSRRCRSRRERGRSGAKFGRETNGRFLRPLQGCRVSKAEIRPPASWRVAAAEALGRVKTDQRSRLPFQLPRINLE